MSFDKDAKIREASMTFFQNGQTRDRTYTAKYYTLYHINKEAHLSINLPRGVYIWNHENFQFFMDEEIDFLSTMMRSMIEVSEVNPAFNVIDIHEAIVSAAGAGHRMMDVVKLIVEGEYQNIRIIPGNFVIPPVGKSGETIDKWVPNFCKGFGV